eukprot:1154567-Pelagomonas_calceolata.AAC.3
MVLHKAAHVSGLQCTRLLCFPSPAKQALCHIVRAPMARLLVFRAGNCSLSPGNHMLLALQQGHGREICGVLDGLVDYVLERRNFTYKRPMHLPDTCVQCVCVICRVPNQLLKHS